MKHPHTAIVGTGLTGFIVFVAGISLGWFGFPAIITSKVKDGVLLENDTEAYERWRKLPLALEFNLYMFNVTNPEEVLNGGNPIVEEIGPYVYLQYREKYDIVNEINDTISYYQNTTYYFNKEKSGNLSEDDVVTLLNIALLGTALKVKKLFSMALTMMNPIVKQIFPNEGHMFLTASVREHMWEGVTVIDCNGDKVTKTAKSLCGTMKSQLPMTVFEDSPGLYKMAYFRHKNATNDGRFRVNRGLVDNKALGRIEEWKGEPELQVWSGDNCNKINGTDSTIFPPFWSKTDQLYIFVPDACRSLYAVYEKETKYKGVPAIRFVGSVFNLQDSREYPPNSCFCLAGEDGEPQCLKGGAVDLFSCCGVSIIMTLPHFYNASPDYQKYVQGLNPVKEKHETYIDIEPKSGVPLRGYKRMQLNMFLTKIEQLDVLTNVSEGLFPLIWAEEGVELHGESLEIVQSLYSAICIFSVLKWVLVAVGVVLMCVSMYIAASKQNMNNNELQISDNNRVMVSYDNKGYMHKPEGMNDTLSITAITDIINNDQNEFKKRKIDRFPGRSHAMSQTNRTDESVGLGTQEDKDSNVTLSNVFM